MCIRDRYVEGRGVFQIRTDIDVLVVSREPGRPGEVVHQHQVKSGRHDQPNAAERQLEIAVEAFGRAVDDPSRLILLDPDGTDLAPGLDLSTIPRGSTSGPLDKGFDNELPLLPADLHGLALSLIHI